MELQHGRRWPQTAAALALPLVLGALSALVSAGGMQRFGTVAKPAFAPPDWLFPVVWVVLYLLMGYASLLVCRSAVPVRRRSVALGWYGAQLAANALWSPLFFRWALYLPALLWLLVLLALVLITLVRFWRIQRRAGLLLLPYLGWLSFAWVLNAAIWRLNP